MTKRSRKPRRVRAALLTAAEEIRDRLTPSHISLDDPRAEQLCREWGAYKRRVHAAGRRRNDEAT
jgi:hypothetical protein